MKTLYFRFEWDTSWPFGH